MNKSFYIDQDKIQFFPGETMKGYVYFIPKKNGYIEDIRMSFKLIENWIFPCELNKTETNTQTISEFGLNIKRLFPEQLNKSIYLLANTYKFPYKFKVPSFLSPSFEYPTQKIRAYLRYSLEAKIKSSEFSGNTSIYIIVKAIKKNNLDSDNNLNVEKSLNIKKWGLIGSGSTILKASYTSKYYKISDIIPLNINIDNSQSKLKVTKCKIDFIRKMTFRDKVNLRNIKIYDDKLIKKKLDWEVKKHEIKNFEYKLYLRELLFSNLTYDGYVQPYKKVNIPILDLMPSIDSGIIKCEYLIKITAYYENFVKKAERPRIFLPINIIHKLEDNYNNYNIEDSNEDDIQRAIEASLQEQKKDNVNINFQEEEDIRKAIEESKKEEEERKNKTVINYSYNNNNYFNNNNIIINFI